MKSVSSTIPSALEKKYEIQNMVETHKPVFFLDYDGTLTPIVSRPEDAVLSTEMRNVLRELAQLCTVAIVSGRDRADVESLVDLKELIYAGSHGFDITGPNDMHMEQPEGQAALPALNEAEQELEEALQDIAGSQVERKRFAIAVHYRNVPEDQQEKVISIAEQILANHPPLKKSSGKMIVELQPDIDWDKGRALVWLLDKLNLDTPDILPFYIGDDLTDENAFRELVEDGVGILVGEHGEKTYATYSLQDVEETRVLLEQLTEMLESKRKE